MTKELERVGERQPEKIPVATPVSVKARVWAPELTPLTAVIEVCATAMTSAVVSKLRDASLTVTQKVLLSKLNVVTDVSLPEELAELATDAKVIFPPDVSVTVPLLVQLALVAVTTPVAPIVNVPLLVKVEPAPETVKVLLPTAKVAPEAIIVLEAAVVLPLKD